MAEQNRVTPFGDIVAIPLRGAWLGNRGRIHSGHRIVRSHASDLWITCVLEFRGRYSQQWTPTHYTHLYFHDEAVSFAAGHRPCAECRRADYNAYRTAWGSGFGIEPPAAPQLNRQLHAERIVRGSHVRRFHALPWRELPDGAFVRIDDAPALVVADRLVPWTVSGYGRACSRPAAGDAEVVTPPSSIVALQNGYRPQIDASALG
jgi:hypothetical protein